MPGELGGDLGAAPVYLRMHTGRRPVSDFAPFGSTSEGAVARELCGTPAIEVLPIGLRMVNLLNSG